MKNQTLSVGRMLHLEKPGVDTGKAGMCRPKAKKGSRMPTRPGCLFLSSDEWGMAIAPILTEDKRRGVGMMPAFTLQDIMEVPPEGMRTGIDAYWPAMSHDGEEWYICRPMSDGSDRCKESRSDPLPEAAYDMPCWCAGNGYLKTDKEE